MKAWGLTHVGMVRKENQDSFYLSVFHEDNTAVCVVCDGMGGAKAGNVASELAVNSFVSEIKNMIQPDMNESYMRDITTKAVSVANDTVYLASQSNENYSGMGTTLVGAIAAGGVAVVSNIGDSRAYYINSGGINRITKDHSLVEYMVNKGNITVEEAKHHPSRNLVTRVVGTEAEVECDLYRQEIEKGEFILLCSDGLSNVIDEQEILYEVLHGGEPSECCVRLVNMVNLRGGPDNVTVVLLSAD